jgi:ubiquinone/menaquinone biosynthesis C-methylase UbiE
MENLVREFPMLRDQIQGARVLDIGCSEGLEAIALARLGARAVIGIDIRIDTAEAARLKAELAPGSRIELRHGDAHDMKFEDASFDAVVSLASFEHFLDPFRVLSEGVRVLKPGGRFYLTSGVWGHPYGAHMHFFTKTPWIQFLFSEETIMNVRGLYRSDGARRFHEVEGGLNQIGVRAFLRYVDDLGLELEHLDLDPVKGLRFLTRIPYANELFTNLIRAIVVKPVR